MPRSINSASTNVIHRAMKTYDLRVRRQTRLEPRNPAATIASIARKQAAQNQPTAESEAYFAVSTAEIPITPREVAMLHAVCSPNGRWRKWKRFVIHVRQKPGATSTGTKAATPRRQPRISHQVNELTFKIAGPSAC